MYIQKLMIGIMLSMFSVIGFSQKPLSIDHIIDDTEIKKGEINALYFLVRESLITDFSDKDFIDAAFMSAQLLDTSNKIYEVKARYNIELDEVQILFNEKINILYPHLVQAIQINHTVLSPQLIEKNDEKNFTYLKIAVAGKISLYEKVSKKKKDNNPLLYVRNTKGQTSIIKPKRKNILSLLTDRGETVESFVSDKNLNYSKVEDLQVIFNYYNSL